MENVIFSGNIALRGRGRESKKERRKGRERIKGATISTIDQSGLLAKNT